MGTLPGSPATRQRSGALEGSPSVRRERLGNLLCFAGVGIDFLTNDTQRHLIKISLKGAVDLDEFGPQKLVNYKGLHSGPPTSTIRAALSTSFLTRIATGAGDTVAAAFAAEEKIASDRGVAIERLRATMLIMETVAQIRRQHFVKGKTIKEIARGPPSSSNVHTGSGVGNFLTLMLPARFLACHRS